MIKIGQYNTLSVSRIVEFGAYLTDAEHTSEVLLPARYITEPLKEGDSVDVFIYTDSEDRPVATTERPAATVGEFAYLDVKAVNRIGAFLDWGLMKDLLVPFSEQKARMVKGGRYLVYLYLDDASKRVVASAKTARFLGNVIPDYKAGDMVDTLVCDHTPIGFTCIVDNLHRGMIYDNELHGVTLATGQRLKARVKRVRPDGKIDLLVQDHAARRTDSLALRILEDMTEAGGCLPLTEKAAPADIEQRYHCSKRDFKQAIGHLLKQGKIVKNVDGSVLLAP